MPELPEVEIVKRSLSKMINNTTIVNIKIKNKNLRYKLPVKFSRELNGEKILNISRRSKYLIFHFEKKILLAHLGMSGKFILIRDHDKRIFKTSFYYNLNINKKHNHVYFKLNNGYILIYNDVRRFGFLKVFKLNDIKKIPFLKKLGFEPFSKKFNLEYFKNYIKYKKRNIKNLLMDQTFVSGIGNIYVNEVLFASKIKPLRSCNSLKSYEIKSIIFNIKKILKLSISKGGSSIKDFQNTLGKNGNFQQFFYVYGKYAEECSRISCKGNIKKVMISARSSFYCSNCQK